ncbi:MAG: hypothetical protein ABI905_15935 [Betaproteobacteria bacterium]
MALFSGGCGQQLASVVLGPVPTVVPPTDPLTPGPSPDSFPLQVAYKLLLADGRNEILLASNACSGQATIRYQTSVPDLYEGIMGFSTTQTITFNATQCSVLALPLDKTFHVDARYAPIGESFAARDYGVLTGAIVDLPSTIRLSDTMTYATLRMYTDSTRSVPAGSRLLSYAAEMDTISTLLLALTARDFDNAGALKRTRTDRFRLRGNGTMSLRAIDYQDHSTGQVLNLRAP